MELVTNPLWDTATMVTKMHAAKRITASIACFSLLWVTGCVGPGLCGPKNGCGPISIHRCGGCGDCDGCGELYIDPWINHPATGDPCDRCGNHNGQSCGACRSVFAGFASLWGYRCDDGGGCDGACGTACASPLLGGCGGGCGGTCGGCEPACDTGCGSCDSGCDSCSSGGHDQMYLGGDSLPPGSYVESQPMQTYRPSRTRQIFKPRGSVAEGARPRVEY